MLPYKQVFQQYETLNDKSKGSFAIAATVALLIILVLLIYPAITYITKVNKEISDAKGAKVALETKLIAIEQARVNLSQYQEDLKLLDSALPLGSKVADHVRNLERLVKGAKLTLTNIQTTNVPLSTPALNSKLETKKLPYSLVLNGTFPNFQRLLENLESFIRISQIKTLNIEALSKGRIDGSLEMESYFFGSGAVVEVSSPESETTSNNESGQ